MKEGLGGEEIEMEGNQKNIEHDSTSQIHLQESCQTESEPWLHHSMADWSDIVHLFAFLKSLDGVQHVVLQPDPLEFVQNGVPAIQPMDSFNKGFSIAGGIFMIAIVGYHWLAAVEARRRRSPPPPKRWKKKAKKKHVRHPSFDLRSITVLPSISEFVGTLTKKQEHPLRRSKTPPRRQPTVVEEVLSGYVSDDSFSSIEQGYPLPEGQNYSFGYASNEARDVVGAEENEHPLQKEYEHAEKHSKISGGGTQDSLNSFRRGGYLSDTQACSNGVAGRRAALTMPITAYGHSTQKRRRDTKLAEGDGLLLGNKLRRLTCGTELQDWAAVKIQNVWRGWMAHETLVQARRASTRIKCFWLQQRHYKAARNIQKIFRGHIFRVYLFSLFRTVVFCQNCRKAVALRRNFLKMRRAVILIQKVFRGFRARSQTKVMFILKSFERYLTLMAPVTRHHAKMLVDEVQRQKACVKIQQAFQRHLAQKRKSDIFEQDESRKLAPIVYENNVGHDNTEIALSF